MAGGLRSGVPKRATSRIQLVYHSASGGSTCTTTCPSDSIALSLPSLECWRDSSKLTNGNGPAAIFIQNPSGMLNGTDVLESLSPVPYKICACLQQGVAAASACSYQETGLTLLIQVDQIVLYANQRVQQPASMLPGLMVSILG